MSLYACVCVDVTWRLDAVDVGGAPNRDGVLDSGRQQVAVDSQEPGRTLKINYSEVERA